MTNEWKEFKAYTGKLVYRSSGKKDRTFLGRFTIDMMCEFVGFKRILTTIVRGYLFHAKDGSLLPGDPRDRLDYALNALKAWCSVPDRSNNHVPPVDFRELADVFPELVDKNGNGWYYRHAKRVMDYAKKNPGIVHSSIVKKCEGMRRGFTKKWQKEVRGLQVPLFALNTKAGWKLRFDDILADALEAGPLRMVEYELPQHVSDMLSILCPEDVPVDVLKDIAAFYLANRREDTDWVVLPVANFEAYYGKVYLGHLTKIKDANGNETQITYDPTSVNGSALKNMRITSISEKLHGNSSVGQTITFAYTNDKLSSITVPNGLNRSYTYANDDLTSVSSADSKNCTYTYTEHRLTQAKNIDNYNVNYAYDSSGRVISASEKANTTAGNSLAYDYTWNVTTVTDDQDRDVIYQFNDAGQAVSIRNAEGQAVFAAYGSGNNNPTKLTAVSKMQDTVVNLLDNHGFDIGSYGSGWTRTDDAIFYAGYPYTGANSVRLSANNYVEQTAAVAAGNTYTFSAYFTGASGGYVKVLNGSTVLAESDTVVTYGTTGTDWSRGVCTFTVPSGVSSVKVRIGKNNDNTSYTYTDAAQLEIGETPNRYNMLVNSDFTNGTNRYSTNGLTSSDTVVTDSNASHPTSLSTNVMKLIGSAITSKHVYQDISVRNGQQGDTYSFGGWCRSNSVPLSTQIYSYDPVQTRSYGVKCLKVQFYQDSTFRNEVTAYFNADTEDWQFACSSAVAGASYNKVRLIACFDYTRNEAYFDGLQLYREQFSQSYTYDSNGNLTGYHSLIGQEPTLTYDSNNNVTSSKDALNHTTTYTYDSHHNLLTSTSPTGVVTTNTYDTNGSVTSTKVGNSTDYIKTSTTYDSASALATAVTDARGNSVTYGYNSTTRQQTSITDPKGNVSTYSYGYASSMLRLASLTSDGTGTVNYTYDTYGKLTQIGRGTTNYKFAYDSWGRPTTTKVGNTTLSTNAYDAYGRLSMVSYGNGFKTRYEYDSLDRTSKIYQGTASNASSTAAYEFIYNGEGDLYELRNYKTHRATFFEYDHAGRCMASTEKTFTGGNGSAISYTGTVAGYKYEYDLNNSLTKLTCELIGTSWSTTYSYDNDNRPTAALLHNGRSFVNTYDGMGRITSVKLKNGSSTILNTAITYVSGANGSKTALVSTYKNGNDSAYNYEYDANGNITKIWRGSSTYDNATEKVLYTYDSANQLIQEDLYYGSGNSSNVTYQYSYDQWGNITSKKTYAYQNTSGTALSEDTYMYGNLQWGDKLLKFNGQTISYDSIGNPTSYLGTTLSWQGKQLTTYVGSSKTISFSYNEDGLRLKKTVNNVDTNYYYNGSVLMAMTSGTIYQRFSYDASGKVVSVDYSENSGSSYTTYYYLRNAQGDIIKLIDGSGSTVVEYSYDSWGKKVSTTGTLATTLGKYQPFRYRGYVYDEETQWYYLQSRYYDPSVRRFISADVYLSTGQGVIGHNAFAYCNNNPLNSIDSNGEIPLMNTWNYACTDSGSCNSYYSREKTPPTDSLLNKFLAVGKRYAARSDTIVSSIRAEHSEYTYTKWERIRHEPPMKYIELIAPFLLGELVNDLPTDSKIISRITTATEIGAGVYELLKKPDYHTFEEGHTYDAVVVTIHGWERNSLTGEWICYTESMCFADASAGSGSPEWVFAYCKYEYWR